jgi:hypothetical protein
MQILPSRARSVMEASEEVTMMSLSITTMTPEASRTCGNGFRRTGLPRSSGIDTTVVCDSSATRSSGRSPASRTTSGSEFPVTRSELRRATVPRKYVWLETV